MLPRSLKKTTGSPNKNKLLFLLFYWKLWNLQDNGFQIFGEKF